MPSTVLKQLLKQRHSVRGFLNKEVTPELLEEIFTLAQHAVSNCNTQPWKTFVASANVKDNLKRNLVNTVMTNTKPESDFQYYSDFKGEHQVRQIECAKALYHAMGVERGNKAERKQALLRNYEFFGAPHVAIICMPTSFEINNALDIGIYLQSLMLIMESFGIGSCAQGALSFYPQIIKDTLNIPESMGVLVGLSFGYEDKSQLANNARTSRAMLSDSVTFLS
ncbi:nitroreductase [Thalassotalea psychrophila]|uniref:Nitroreductase n=1 Tax=Thalassotalea psychrophila TaxID=3065647 RepID=A0ABY9TZ84_9GAMM|nr:nitroreductase [Colwelliaceae bacterium SQ149]